MAERAAEDHAEKAGEQAPESHARAPAPARVRVHAEHDNPAGWEVGARKPAPLDQSAVDAVDAGGAQA